MRIKRLYLFLIKSYLGTFLATFFICLFVVLMQFLWKYVDELVGKGLDFSVLAQFFYYAALSLVPMALPLAILLSSLMTFGNFGERLELLAMKAAGISLFRIMRPFIVFIMMICIGAFFFSNNAMPVIQAKLYTLLYSMRQKTPDVDIPEGSFYRGINGYNIYVREKDPDRQLLKNLMIYDFSGGFENAQVMAADSGRLSVSADKRTLVLDLYSGESFENLKNQSNAMSSIPYRRESFAFKEILIDFDSNFSMADASVASNKYMSKNYAELTVAIDSIQHRLDSLWQHNFTENRGNYFNRSVHDFMPASRDSLESYEEYSVSALTEGLSPDEKRKILDRFISWSERQRSSEDFCAAESFSIGKSMRRHDIERHRKFTLSFACLVFFFIGAPLGAIIRKGGLGLPVVISVILFVIYYIIDNMGYKMAREGVWHVWSGIWLSSAVLFPFGVFLSYKAATDKIVSLSELGIVKSATRFFKRKKSKGRNS